GCTKCANGLRGIPATDMRADHNVHGAGVERVQCEIATKAEVPDAAGQNAAVVGAEVAEFVLRRPYESDVVAHGRAPCLLPNGYHPRLVAAPSSVKPRA